LLTFGPGHWFWLLAFAVLIGVPEGVQRSSLGVLGFAKDSAASG
jgi:hypothetical protein